MKLLPENRKKTLWLVVILTLSVVGIIYLNFLRSSPSVPVAVGVLPPLIKNSGNVNTTTTVSSLGSGRGSLLPYGSKLDINIFESSQFKALKSSQKVEVKSEELGKGNPFAR